MEVFKILAGGLCEKAGKVLCIYPAFALVLLQGIHPDHPGHFRGKSAAATSPPAGVSTPDWPQARPQEALGLQLQPDMAPFTIPCQGHLPILERAL